MKAVPFVVLLLMLASSSAQETAECPARYPSLEVSLPSELAPGGWQGQVTSNLLLSGGGMMVGPPLQHGELRGDDRITRNGYEIHYGFNKHDEKWFRCDYGRDGSVQLLHRMGDLLTQCVLKIKRRDMGLHTVTLSCR